MGKVWRWVAVLEREAAWRLGKAAWRLGRADWRVAAGRAAVALRGAGRAAMVLRGVDADCAEDRASARAEALDGISAKPRQSPRRPAIKERMKPPFIVTDVTAYYVRANEASPNTPGFASP